MIPPPLFEASAADDLEIPVGATLSVLRQWRSAKGHGELHLYASGGHVFGVLSQLTRSDSWREEFQGWLKWNRFTAASD